MIISAVKINSTFRNMQRQAMPVAFKAREQDVFLREDKDEYMTTNNYFSCNNEFEKVKDKYAHKIKVMPLIMGSVMHDVKGYMGQKFDAEKFVELFMQDVSTLVKRVDLGEDKDEYCENYAPELNFIADMNIACDAFSQGKIEKNRLDRSVKNNVESYVKDKFVRKKHFVV